MENLLRKTKSTFSLRPCDLHKSKLTPISPQHLKHSPQNPLSLSITKLKQTQDKMVQEVDLMPDGIKLDSFSPLNSFMATIAKQNATYLLLKQLPYAIWSNRPLSITIMFSQLLFIKTPTHFLFSIFVLSFLFFFSLCLPPIPLKVHHVASPWHFSRINWWCHIIHLSNKY